MVCCYQVTKIDSSRYGFALASSARNPCNFGPLTDLAISVFREMSMNIMLTQILTSLCMSAPKRLHEKNWLESLPIMELISSSTKFSLNSCSHSGISGSSHRLRQFNHGLLFNWLLEFCRLGFPQVPPFYHQPIQTLALERYHY